MDLFPQPLALQLLAQFWRHRAVLDVLDEAPMPIGLIEALSRGKLEVAQDHRDVDTGLDRRIHSGPYEGSGRAASAGVPKSPAKVARAASISVV